MVLLATRNRMDIKRQEVTVVAPICERSYLIGGATESMLGPFIRDLGFRANQDDTIFGVFEYKEHFSYCVSIQFDYVRELPQK